MVRVESWAKSWSADFCSNLKMATVKQSLEQFQQILQSLEEERERYRAQKLNLEVQSFTIVEDYTTADM